MFAQIICGFSAQMGFKNVFAQIISSFDLRALAMQSGAAAGIDPDGFLVLSVEHGEKFPEKVDIVRFSCIFTFLQAIDLRNLSFL